MLTAKESFEALDRLINDRCLGNMPPQRERDNGYGCEGCPFAVLSAGQTREEAFNDESEAFYDCRLIGKDRVWGEDPECTREDWRRAALPALAARAPSNPEPATSEVERVREIVASAIENGPMRRDRTAALIRTGAIDDQNEMVAGLAVYAALAALSTPPAAAEWQPDARTVEMCAKVADNLATITMKMPTAFGGLRDRITERAIGCYQNVAAAIRNLSPRAASSEGGERP